MGLFRLYFGASALAEPCVPLDCDANPHRIYVAVNTFSLTPAFSVPDLDLGFPLAGRAVSFSARRRAVDEFGRVVFSARLLDTEYSQNQAGIWSSALPDPMPCALPYPVFNRVARSGMAPPGSAFQEWEWDYRSVGAGTWSGTIAGNIGLFTRNNNVAFAASILGPDQGSVKWGLWLRRPAGGGYVVEKVYVDGDAAPSSAGAGPREYAVYFPSSVGVDVIGHVVFIAWTVDPTLDPAIRHTSERLGLYLYDPAVPQILRIAEEGEQLLSLGVVHRLHAQGVSQSPSGRIAFTADVTDGNGRRGVFLATYENNAVSIQKVVLAGDAIPGSTDEFLDVLGIDPLASSGDVVNEGAVSVNDLGEVVFVGATFPSGIHLMRYSNSTLTRLLTVGDAVPWRGDSRVIGSIAVPVISNPVASETLGQVSFVCEEHEPAQGGSTAFVANTVAVWYPHPVGIFHSGFIKVVSHNDPVPKQSAWNLDGHWSVLNFHDLYSVKVNDSGQVAYTVRLQKAAENPPGPTTDAIYVWDPRLGYSYCVMRKGWSPAFAGWSCHPGVVVTDMTSFIPRIAVTADRSMGTPTTGVPFSSWIAHAPVDFNAPINCADECDWSTVLLIRFVAGCNAADIARSDGYPEPDNRLDNGDFNLFVNNYFLGCLFPSEVPCSAADICGSDGSGPPDGQVDNGDFTLFLAAFFSGC